MELFDDCPQKCFVRLSKIAEKVMQEKYFLNKKDKHHIVNRRESATQLTTGLKSLDSMLGSFKAGELYAIGGRPGMGKTMLLLQIALTIVLSTNKRVYFESLDMSAEQIVLRLISQIVDIDHNALIKGNLSKEQKDLLYLCWSIMDAMPLFICDSFASVEDIGHFMKNEPEGAVLLIDYLQLMDAAFDSANNAATITRLSEITRSLYRLAQEKKIPIIFSSQLPVELEQRLDKRPILQDMRRIEMDADGVIFVYRNSYYSDNVDNEVELIFAKNRHGERGTVYVIFNGNRLKFDNK